MTSEIFDALNALGKLAPKLNSVADDAAQVVREVEKRLDNYGLMIHASVLINILEISERIQEETDLEYRRIGGKFRIAIVRERHTATTDANDTSPTAHTTLEVTPWLECGRELKLESFEFLPDLLAKIIQNVQKAIAGAEKAAPAVRKFLDSMRKEIAPNTSSTGAAPAHQAARPGAVRSPGE